MQTLSESSDAAPGQTLETMRQAVACQVDAVYARRSHLAPHEAQTLQLLGFLGLSAGLAGRAQDLFTQCLTLDANLVAAHLGLGKAFQAQGKFMEAIRACQRALVLNPHSAETHRQLGSACEAQGLSAEARACYQEAIALDPGSADACYQLGSLHHTQRELPEALTCYRRAYGIDSRHAPARFAEALVLLLAGDLRQGWPKYESRWLVPPIPALRPFPQPLWLGQFSLAGKTILLHAEQGLGDMLQFARYVPRLVSFGARVLLEVQPPLQALLTSVPGVAEVCSYGEALPEFDTHCPLASLPLACATELHSIPAEVPYVRAPRTKSAYWQARLAAGGGFRVGVVWAGHPRYHRDRDRSLPLALFQALFQEPQCRIFSLQKDLAAADARLLGTLPNVTNLVSELHDFTDTAAIIEHLDCVISADTAVAHLAGALGKPVWILLPFVPDWRWLLARNDSPWYPTASLFRQSESGNWLSVLVSLATRLALARKTERHDS